MAKAVIAYEDESALRAQLENVFYAIREEFNLMASFPDARSVVTHLSAYKPDIIIMDIQMNEDDDGLNALHRIKTISPETKVMMLTTFDVDDKVFNAICLGADGYMLKTDFLSQQLPHEAMRKSLRILFEGGAYLTPSVAKRILNLFADQSIAEKINRVKERFKAIFKNDYMNRAKTSGLTFMQLNVLHKIVDGKSTSEIARDFDLSENTINSHIKGIYNVLEVNSRSKAIKVALEEKWFR